MKTENYKATVTDTEIEFVKVTVSEEDTFYLTHKEAGDELYWTSEALRNHTPYNLYGVELDVDTTLNLYKALSKWSEQFHDELIALIEQELAEENHNKLN